MPERETYQAFGQSWPVYTHAENVEALLHFLEQQVASRLRRVARIRAEYHRERWWLDLADREERLALTMMQAIRWWSEEVAPVIGA